MSDYTPITDFSVKDGLTSGDPEKIIAGADLDAELAAIQTAILSKFDSNEIATEAEAEAETLDTKIITPLQLKNVLQDNAGVAHDLKELTVAGFSAADAIFGWDDSAVAAIGFTLGDGLATNGTAIEVDEGNGLIFSTGVLAVGAGNGITVNTNDVALSDQAVSTTVAVDITSGVVNLDIGSLTSIDIDGIGATDSILIQDGAALKQMDIRDMGVRVVTSSTTQTFALGDSNSLQLLTGATTRAWTIPTNASVAFAIGTIIYLGARDTGAITVTVGGSVTLTSLFSNGVSTTDTVSAGGLAVLIKVGTDEWMLSGDITD
jgi:hypothetical protein